MYRKIISALCLLCAFTFVACDDDNEDAIVKVSSIEFEESALELEVGATKQLKVNVLPEDAFDKSVKWSSSNEEVATIDESGLLTAVEAGNATITATAVDSEISKTCEITVLAKEVVPEGKIRFKGQIVDEGTKSAADEATRELLVVYTEKFTEDNFADGMTTTKIEIAEDGSFSLDIEDEKEFIVFLMENNRVKGLVGIDAGGEEYWENLNSGYLSGVIELGNVPSSSEDGLLIAEKTIADLSVVEGKSELIQKMSRLDDHIRTYMNFTNTGFKNFASPGFVFSSNLVFGEQIDADDLSYAGYQIYAWGKGLENTMHLFPPAEVARGNGEKYNDQTPIHGEAFDPGSEFKFMGFIGGETSADLLQGDIPAGEWSMQTTSGTELASYSLNSILPLENDKISVPVPAITINSDADGVITEIDLNWQYYRGGELVTIDDVEPLKDRISNTNIEYIQDENTGEDHPFNYNDTSIVPDNQNVWSVNGENNNKKLNTLVIGYTIDCVFYQVKMVIAE
ncbi:Ig-like domain-containing protein [Marinifilum flexuosum]|uniref:Ig-like protein group 2 n=1 Tax=Marinifilum flexuosum TaxID=1117708 RepID=A0A419WF88_9BACT|nr:Ig-like domain-containing protein [Marinifilum flexuosum]RKD94052.1 Ig-like protein group 2 [Marinifilum flexuosum]